MTPQHVRLLASACAFLTVAACGDSMGEEDPAGDSIFQNLRVEQLTSTSAVVLFDTTIPTSCEVRYGMDVMRMDMTATDPNMLPGQMETKHTVPIEDLKPGTGYMFRAVASDGSGMMYMSEAMRLDTLTSDDPTANMVNVAMVAAGTTVVSVSSNWAGGDNDSSFGIHNALDGMMATEWSSDGDGDDAFVMLDFGQMRTISMFGFRSRMMMNGTSITMKLQLVLNGGGTVIGPLDTPDHTQRYLFDIDPPVSTRMIRVEAVETTGGNTGAREIQFFSAP